MPIVVVMPIAEMYNASANKWVRVANMRTKRGAPAAACLNGRVYVAGGDDGKKYLTTMEYYDADADNWVEVASMKIARNLHKLVELDSILYAIGGWNGVTFFNSVECYDARIDSWKDGAPLGTARANAACIAFEVSIVARRMRACTF